MPVFDWSRFVVRVDINAPVEELYKGWATRSGIEHWFLKWCEYHGPANILKGENEFVEKGDTYKWRWHGYPDSVTEEGNILEANGKDLFKFSFGNAGDCTVRIKTEQGKTIVELLQENIPTDEKGMQYYHVGCKTGWTFHLADMKSIYEGGVDLRNKDESLHDMLNS
ncbi:MAG TPA: SRPBCC domain-containing protein [Chitinophagaceae bacterium]|jgi:uncharacterized protein YndB with AHSA1/START domain|nr:SRPBCC domain-containing protein [Chitinophagaceae bacterium]